MVHDARMLTGGRGKGAPRPRLKVVDRMDERDRRFRGGVQRLSLSAKGTRMRAKDARSNRGLTYRGRYSIWNNAE